MQQPQPQGAQLVTDIDPVIIDLGREFQQAGHEISLVGGPVRDAILGRDTNDFDFTTSASVQVTEEILNSWADTTWDIGRRFGTIGARKGDLIVEVTTYRSDEYDGQTRKPVVSFGTSLEGDLARRDFTVNAMAVRLPALEFVDPFGGLQDLAQGVLRTPIEPEVSFTDDPLRMLRAARFSAQLGFEIAAEAFTAILEHATKLENISIERVQEEFVKLMLSADPVRGVRALVDTGLAEQFIPEIPGMRAAVDEHARHKDVYEHSLTVLQQAIDLETDADGPVPCPDLILRIAALLHDIGKPATRKFEPNGRVSFHHHEIVGAKMTKKRLRALRFDNQTVKAVTKLVELHLRFHGYGEGKWTDSAVRRYVTDAGDQLERLHRLTRADCTSRNVRKVKMLSKAYDDLEARIAELAEKEEIAAIRPDLDGRQIMEILEIPPGPEVGRAYAFLKERRMERGPVEPEVATAELLEWWRTQV